MNRLLLAILAAGVAAFTLACAAHSGSPPDRQPAAPRVLDVAHALRDIAAGDVRVSVALGPLVPLSMTENAKPPTTLRLAGFRDADGYVLREIEVRIRHGGIDSSPLILAHIEASPCLDLDMFARRLEADSVVRTPPSPHVPDGTGGSRGYAIEHADGGEFRVIARNETPGCTTLIRARQPRSVRQLYYYDADTPDQE